MQGEREKGEKRGEDELLPLRQKQFPLQGDARRERVQERDREREGEHGRERRVRKREKDKDKERNYFKLISFFSLFSLINFSLKNHFSMI